MLEHHELDEIGRLMESWAAAYENATSLNKRIAELDARRAELIDKLAAEEEKARVAEETVNKLIEEIDDDEEAAKQVEELAKEKLFGVVMMDIVHGV